MSIGNRIKGAAEELGGKVKEGIGNLTNNEPLRQEGLADQNRGQARQDVAKTEQQIKGGFEKASGRVQGAAGVVTGDESKQAEGKVEELKGEVRQKLNK